MSEVRRATVAELQAEGVLLVEDGNHGENRPRPDEFVDSGVAFVRAADMDAGRVLFETASRINDRARQRITKGIGAAGDILLSHKGTVGKVAIVQADAPPFVCSPQTTFWRTLRTDVLDRRYLYAYLRSAQFHRQLTSRAGETDMAPYVSLTAQRQLVVVVPPIADQRRIAAILGSLDEKIELNSRMAAVLRDLGRRIFEWRVSDCLAQGIFEERPLSTILETLETGSRPKGGVSRYSEGIPSIGAESITRLGEFDFSKTKYIPMAFYDSMRRGRISSRDVLLYKDGGRPGVFEPHVTMVGDGFPFDMAAINEHVYRLRAAAPYSQTFLYFWLSGAQATEEMRVKGTGVAIPGLNSSALGSIRVPALTPEALGGLDRALEPLVARVLLAARESHVLAQIRDVCLPRLLSGELDGRPATAVR